MKPKDKTIIQYIPGCQCEICRSIRYALKERDEGIEEAVTNYWQDVIIRILKELGIKK